MFFLGYFFFEVLSNLLSRIGAPKTIMRIFLGGASHLAFVTTTPA